MAPVVQDRLPALKNLVLAHGAHKSFKQGACIMEAVAYVAGEPFTDHPTCASPILGSFLRAWNDRLDNNDRQLLKPYIVRLIDTNTGPEDEQTRKWMLLDWLVHEYAPAMFRTAGLTAEAEAFEQLAAITGPEQWDEARATVYEVRDKAWQRRAEARKRAVADAVAAADAAADADAAAAANAGAAAVAAAVAAADAVAGADAGAAAGAAAVAAADAAAAAVADAVAGAVAGAAAVADAVAAADAYRQAIAAAAKARESGGDYWAQRTAAYEVLYPFYKERLAEITPGLQASALLLLDRLIDVSNTKTKPAVTLDHA